MTALQIDPIRSASRGESLARSMSHPLPADGCPPADFPEWTMRVEVDPDIHDGRHYHADLYREGEWICQVSMDGAFAKRADAEQALSGRMRQWLVGYDVLPDTCTSGFQVL